MRLENKMRVEGALPSSPSATATHAIHDEITTTSALHCQAPSTADQDLNLMFIFGTVSTLADAAFP